MKEIAPPLHKRVWGRLRRSDLRPLANLLSSCGKELEISSDKYTFDSVDELLSSEAPVTRLHFRIRFQDFKTVSVDLDSASIWIHASDTDTFALGIISKLDAFLRIRRAGVNPWVSLIAWIGSFISGVGALLYLLLDRILHVPWGDYTVTIALSSGFALFWNKAYALAFSSDSNIPIKF